MPEKAKPTGIFSPSFRRRFIYGFAWALVFCIAAAELGLVSQQLHNGGNSYDNYGNKMFKHVLGLTLFSILFTFLLCIGHFYSSVGMMTVLVLIAAVFWGVDAGVIFQSSPYRQYNCGDKDPAATFHGTRWSEPRFFSQCSRIVAMQGLAWAEWGVFVMMFFGMLADILDVRMRPARAFYTA
ncbi:hypothetical protein LshimejAT787_0700480 [Lyophyllum shimeji]|uniref:MARVEL domain-containing protein n=1 Tax=Lyophyllum shimeji TaxID=47721 RepID=A0A9P3PP83_LYOSH|nr:hypothetical protein LshimejAT787_0700480 [Lyophyllum shimeji]